MCMKIFKFWLYIDKDKNPPLKYTFCKKTNAYLVHMGLKNVIVKIKFPSGIQKNGHTVASSLINGIPFFFIGARPVELTIGQFIVIKKR